MGTALHAGGERAALETMLTKVTRCEAGLCSPELDDVGDRTGVNGSEPTAGRTGGSDGPTEGGSRNTGSAVIAAEANQRPSARTGRSSCSAVGQGDEHGLLASLCCVSMSDRTPGQCAGGPAA